MMDTDEQISAFCDGELAHDDLNDCWQQLLSSAGRDRWHRYHLMGDVLRAPVSTTVATAAHVDLDALDFVTRLRARMADERPTALAVPTDRLGAVVDEPRPAAANDGVWRWKLAAGMASFAAVAMMGWHVLGGGAIVDDVQLARHTPSDVHTSASSAPMAVLSVDRNEGVDSNGSHHSIMLRDAQLDEYLAAHRETAGLSSWPDIDGYQNATFQSAAR